MTPDRLRAGIFLPPFHPNDEDPTLALQRDFELVEWLDKLGYDEAWIGEHHSGGYEIISSPELFIAAAAERTKRIRLGTGVVSLPYHHPFMVADRIVQLDHQTKGRCMFGVGPGLLVSDAIMLGIQPDQLRDRLAESLDVIMRLLDGEVVTHKSDWFELREGRLQLRPYTRPRPHVAIASAITPTGGTLAGRYGLGLLCVAASSPAGYDVLDVNWTIANKIAAEHGQRMDAGDLRLLAPIHVAETREQAVANVQWGFDKYLHYSYSLRPEGPIAIGLPTSITLDNVEELNRTGKASIGTPDDAVAMLERFWQKTGGFGCILTLAHNWANFEATKSSYELFMRYVMPKFAGRNVAREGSLGWIRNNRDEFSGAGKAAVMKVVNKYLADEAGKAGATAAE
jgi:limonene 1,2-monooxygenase